MVKIHGIRFSDAGRTVTYVYEAMGAARKYFSSDVFFAGYDQDVSQVPESILYIPFLANVLPIAWFAGFPVEVPSVDADFNASLPGLKAEWARHHTLSEAPSALIASEIITQKIPGDRSAMLFSGGVDAFATYFRHYQEKPDLITIQGADIELTDTAQWENVKAFNAAEPILADNGKHYIRTNFRRFYTAAVEDLLANFGWWGQVQHGMALTGVVAPLSWIRGYSKLYIASTRSVHMEFNAWGSMPEIDDRMGWAGLHVIHDGFELKRQDKVDAIVEAVKRIGTATTVRVCYHDFKTDLNCSDCEKCIRTQIGIIAAGDDPNRYGFKTGPDIYDKAVAAVGKGFKSRGNQFFWQEILEKFQAGAQPFAFGDASETNKRNGALESIGQAIHKPLLQTSKTKKLKYALIHRYPGLFRMYMKLRRKA